MNPCSNVAAVSKCHRNYSICQQLFQWSSRPFMTFQNNGWWGLLWHWCAVVVLSGTGLDKKNTPPVLNLLLCVSVPDCTTHTLHLCLPWSRFISCLVITARYLRVCTVQLIELHILSSDGFLQGSGSWNREVNRMKGKGERSDFLEPFCSRAASVVWNFKPIGLVTVELVSEHGPCGFVRDVCPLAHRVVFTRGSGDSSGH